jgi:hypothetical protein
MSKTTRTRPANREDGRIALRKAQEFYQGGQSEFENERYNSAGLAAIHSGISVADALLIYSTGTRGASQDHVKVSDLVSESIASFRGSPRTQLVGLLKMKNDVAYAKRLITQIEAKRLLNSAGRLLAWAEEFIDD